MNKHDLYYNQQKWQARLSRKAGRFVSLSIGQAQQIHEDAHRAEIVCPVSFNVLVIHRNLDGRVTRSGWVSGTTTDHIVKYEQMCKR